jgi:hypothetical protein
MEDEDDDNDIVAGPAVRRDYEVDGIAEGLG